MRGNIHKLKFELGSNFEPMNLYSIISCSFYTVVFYLSDRGQDIESQEMLRQGFTHAFIMTFHKKEDFTAFLGHPNHVEFSTTFSAAIEKIVLLDFPAVLVKAPA